jgi:hypothetical protein
MTDLSPYVDVHTALTELLADLVPAGHVVTWTGTNLQDVIASGPLIKVARLGGDDDRITAVPRVDADVFATTESSGAPLAELVRQRLLSWPHNTAAGVIDRVITEVAPHEVPYDDPGVRLFTATYRIATRRHAT